MVALLGYFCRGFLQEAGRHLYSRIYGSSVPAKEGTKAPETQHAAPKEVAPTFGIQYAAPPIREPEPTAHVHGLTLAMIKEDVAKAPPMRRAHIEEEYIDIRIDWPVYFRSAREKDGKIRVLLSSEQGGMLDVVCNVDAHAYPQFRILREDAPLRVEGVIASWNIGAAELRDVQLTFLPQTTS